MGGLIGCLELDKVPLASSCMEWYRCAPEHTSLEHFQDLTSDRSPWGLHPRSLDMGPTRTLSPQPNMERLDWVDPPILPAIWSRPAQGSGEEQYISFCFRYIFSGVNHQAGFSPWHAIGWFTKMTTRKRRQAANRVQGSYELGPLITPFVLKKMTAASPDQRAIYDWSWSGNSQTMERPDQWYNF